MAGDARYMHLPAKLAEARRVAQSALDVLAQQTTRALHKNPGALDENGQRIAKWEEMSDALNTQGDGFPPRQKFPLPPYQERVVIRHIHTMFEEAVEAVAELFPVREGGVYPQDIHTDDAELWAVRSAEEILSDNVFIARVRTYVQSKYTNPNTPLTPGNENIFLNTWNSLKTKAAKTGTALRSQQESQQSVFTSQLLKDEYKRMLATAKLDFPQWDASLGVQKVQPQTLAAFDLIAREVQYKVLGTRLFHNVVHLQDEISMIRSMHDALVVQFSTTMSNHKSSRLVDIALRTHPLLDCGTKLLNQTVQFLHARDHKDFRRQYKHNKYFVDSAIWDVVLQIMQIMQNDPHDHLNLYIDYSERSILETLLFDAQDRPDAMKRSVDKWLELIQPDVFEIYDLAPWRMHWTADDLFNAVTAAYKLLPLLHNKSFTGWRFPESSLALSTLVSMLKRMLEDTTGYDPATLELDSRAFPGSQGRRSEAMDTNA